MQSMPKQFPRKDRIEKILNEALQPQKLIINDESHKHTGHLEAGAGDETHLYIEMVASVFVGKTKVACHRIVNSLLADEFNNGLHALRLKLSETLA
jgi:BolA family transcriptional regulator, general stress-responsive regulator